MLHVFGTASLQVGVNDENRDAYIITKILILENDPYLSPRAFFSFLKIIMSFVSPLCFCNSSVEFSNKCMKSKTPPN